MYRIIPILETQKLSLREGKPLIPGHKDSQGHSKNVNPSGAVWELSLWMATSTPSTARRVSAAQQDNSESSLGQWRSFGGSIPSPSASFAPSPTHALQNFLERHHMLLRSPKTLAAFMLPCLLTQPCIFLSHSICHKFTYVSPAKPQTPQGEEPAVFTRIWNPGA